uniref:DNA-dependent metalloprotease WSS1-like n=1 Tax=Rhizophora mucronata TaxID=61149 RepID=A0A2P2K1C8_RHIMU
MILTRFGKSNPLKGLEKMMQGEFLKKWQNRFNQSCTSTSGKSKSFLSFGTKQFFLPSLFNFSSLSCFVANLHVCVCVRVRARVF